MRKQAKPSLILRVQWWCLSAKVVFQATLLFHWTPFTQNDFFPLCSLFSGEVRVNTHSRHGVSDRVQLCRARSLSIALQTRLPIKWRHVKEREVNGSTNNDHGSSEPSNKRPHLQSSCKTYSFLTPRVTLIHIPSTRERTDKKKRRRQLCTTSDFLILPPSALPDSPVESGGHRCQESCGFQRGRGGKSYRLQPSRISLRKSTCRRQRRLRQRLSWKYHSMHNQRVRVTIRYSPVYSSLSPASFWYSARTQGR